jgi:hypothetical protein
MSNSQARAKIFLEGLHSEGVRSTFENLQGLIESLESKNDPDPIEIKLVDSIYSFLEKLNLLENNISTYSKEAINPFGNKLSSLYEDISPSGHIYRD